MNQEQLADLQQRNKATGDRGEDYVLSLERRRLAGHPLLSKVQIEGRKDVGLGYDIASFQSLSSQQIDRYIEIKTYNGNPHFFLSQSEQAAARKHGFRYYIYLVDETRINDPSYEPIIICNPDESLADGCWQQRQQQQEYVFMGDSIRVPDDFCDATVLVGCYNNTTHINWILSRHCYNVRSSEVSSQYGAVSNDAVTTSVRYLLLYNVQSPRSYTVYSIDKAKLVSNAQMRSYGYRNPHAPYYILYHIQDKVQLPSLDIMQLLRTANDKVQRTSGTPIYMQGIMVSRFFDRPELRPGISAPVRHFTNTGKPWTKVQDIKLCDWIQEGRDTAYIALKLYRSSQEVIERCKVLGI